MVVTNSRVGGCSQEKKIKGDFSKIKNKITKKTDDFPNTGDFLITNDYNKVTGDFFDTVKRHVFR